MQLAVIVSPIQKNFVGENEDDFQTQRLINSSVTAMVPDTTKIATNAYLPKCYKNII